MRSTSRSKIVVAAFAAVSLSIAGACQRNDSDEHAAVAATSTDTAPARVDSAAGEVTSDSSADPVPGKWLTDANVFSLLGTMDARQIAAADAELQSWRSDSVRAFAASVARQYAELQHSVDSLAERIHVVPVAPALTDQVAARMQSQIDSMKQAHGGALDRAFLTQQVAGQGLVADYMSQLSDVAEHPELQALLASASMSVGSQLTHARALQAAFSSADSSASAASADSAAKRAARRKR
jgi:predicted outer membrane protein